MAVFAVVVVGAIVFIRYSEKKEEIPVAVETDITTESVDGAKQAENTIVVPEEAMEKDAYPEVNNLIKQYYQALVDGDMDTIKSIKSHSQKD